MRADYLVMITVVLAGLSTRLALTQRGQAQVLTRLRAAQPSTPVSFTFSWPMAAGTGAVGGWWAAGIEGAGIGAIAAVMAWRGWRHVAAGRESAQVERDLPLTMETIARILRSGTSPMLAVQEAAHTIPGPIGRDLDQLALGAQRFGLRAAALAWGTRRPSASLAAHALVVALDAGHGTADALDAVAVTLRDRTSVGREVRALASQAKLSAGVMAFTPLGFAVLLSGSDAGARAFLLHSPIGLACLGVGVSLDLLGYRWMRSIANVVV